MTVSELEIIYQDDHLIAINKPPGISVHKTEIDNSSHVNVMKVLRDQTGQWVYPVHRLDRPTSGVLLFGKRSEIAKALAGQFSERTVKKEYLAIVRGYTSKDEVIDYPLIPKQLKRHLGKPNEDSAQSAITTYRTIGTVEINTPVGRYSTARYSLLKVCPHTGRHRQIRRHMKHIFHPIIGDTSFGDGVHNRFFRDKLHCHRLLLHAIKLRFHHPIDGTKEIILHAKPDSDFQNILEQFSWNSP